jgi:DNA (cytosine-5)-methyltransferase 1
MIRILFGGCGGATLGIRWARPDDSIQSYELEGHAGEVASANVFNHFHIGVDLINTHGWLLLGERTPLNLLWSSPPCQDYSAARRGKSPGGRNGWPATLKAIGLWGPRYFVVENVPGAPWEAWQREVNGLRMDAGGKYHTEVWELNAQDFGVPQHRRRTFLVGRLFYPGKEALPVLRPPVGSSARWTLGDVVPGRSFPWDKTGRDDEGLYWYSREDTQGMAGSKPEWLDRPAPTVVCQEVKGTRACPATNWKWTGGPDRVSDALFLATGLRRASIPMVQKIQGFPDGWDWLDTTAEQQYRMIGNAVPPALAEAVVTALLGS